MSTAGVQGGCRPQTAQSDEQCKWFLLLITCVEDDSKRWTWLIVTAVHSNHTLRYLHLRLMHTGKIMHTCDKFYPPIRSFMHY